MTSSYATAYSEVLEIIKYLPDEERNRIPNEKILFFENNKAENYKYRLDTSKDIANQNISTKAKAILVTLYRDYFATDSQKTKLQNILYQNQTRREEEARKKYNVDNIFAGNKNENISKVNTEINYEQKVNLIVYKESIITKIGKFFRKLFNIK